MEPRQQLDNERSVRLLVVRGPAPAIAGVEVIEQLWSLEHVPLIEQFDLGVMPLPDTPWSRGKCLQVDPVHGVRHPCAGFSRGGERRGCAL